MARPASRTSRAPVVFVAVGILVAVLPAGWLQVVTPVPWEQEILHLTGLTGAGLAAVSPWAMNRNPPTARRFVVWLVLGIGALGVYTLSRSPLFLLTGFTLLFTGMLDMWMARAHMASREYADRLRRPEER